MLDVRGVEFSYGDVPVLSGVDLQVRRGTCTCLMGVNGCGKSTLIDCVLGENRPAAGQVLVDGRPTAQLRPRQLAQLASYVPQVHERSFPYTVEQIVAMGLAAGSGFGAPGPDEMARVDEALAGCGIAHMAQRPYTALSGGQMQMTLLARALVQDAPLVLMDEPTAHLDFRNELVFLETVERLVLERGTTVLMATHAPNQAFHLAAAGVSTRVAVMDGGRVVAEGAPRQVLSEQLLADVFGISARLVEAPGRTSGERMLRQIVPVRTIAAGAGARADAPDAGAQQHAGASQAGCPACGGVAGTRDEAEAEGVGQAEAEGAGQAGSEGAGHGPGNATGGLE